MAKLEKHIRREWESTKDLPHVNIILEKIKEKEGYFNPKRYLGDDEEKFMESLQQWKIAHEKEYLRQFPHLSRAPICHKKILSKSSRPIIFFLYF